MPLKHNLLYNCLIIRLACYFMLLYFSYNCDLEWILIYWIIHEFIWLIFLYLPHWVLSAASTNIDCLKYCTLENIDKKHDHILRKIYQNTDHHYIVILRINNLNDLHLPRNSCCFSNYFEGWDKTLINITSS